MTTWRNRRTRIGVCPFSSPSPSQDLVLNYAYIVLVEKGKEPASPGHPVSPMAGLSISRPTAPPRPSDMSKPLSPRPPPPRHDDSEDDEDDEDENDPFADRNAVVTPKVERSEPTW